MLNQHTIIGHLGKDAETRFTQGGKGVTNFSVATTRSWKDQQTNEWKEATSWHNVVLWGASENKLEGLKKGAQVFVQGRSESRSYEDKEGKKVYVTELIADEVRLLGRKAEGTTTGNTATAKTPAPPPQAPTAPAAAAANRMPPPPAAPAGRITAQDVPF